MIKPEEAFDRIISAIKPLPTVNAPISACNGLTLAQDITARRNQPPADISAMDGFALKYQTGARDYTVIGTSAAGDAYGDVVGEGEALRIYTGAEVPAGADSVIIQENTNWPASGTSVTLSKDAVKGANIRHGGADFTNGAPLLNMGTSLRARHLGLATVAGYDSLDVIKRPVIALLSNGDELAEGSACTGTSRLIPNSNAPMIAAMIMAIGADCIQLGPAKDDPDDIRRCITESPDFDALITIGGASVGDRDYIQSALAELGLNVDFWKIAMKPGKPLIYGKLGDKPFMGLPGNPVSAFVGAFMFALPMVKAMMGGNPQFQQGSPTILAAPMAANGPRTNFLRATIRVSDGAIVPSSSQDSSLLNTLAHADGLIIQDGNCAGKLAGDAVPFITFDPAF